MARKGQLGDGGYEMGERKRYLLASRIEYWNHVVLSKIKHN